MSARLRGGKTAMLLVLVLVAARWSLAVPCLSPCATAGAGARSSTAAHCADAATDGATVTGECDMMRAQVAPATASSTERFAASDSELAKRRDLRVAGASSTHTAPQPFAHSPLSPPGGMRPLRV